MTCVEAANEIRTLLLFAKLQAEQFPKKLKAFLKPDTAKGLLSENGPTSESESELESEDDKSNFEPKNTIYAIDGKTGSDILQILIALEDFCLWRKGITYTFKVKSETLFTIQVILFFVF